MKKKKLTYTKQDEIIDYIKLGIIILMGLAYMWVLWF